LKIGGENNNSAWREVSNSYVDIKRQNMEANLIEER
jgi:hypothetical protein